MMVVSVAPVTRDTALFGLLCCCGGNTFPD